MAFPADFVWNSVEIKTKQNNNSKKHNNNLESVL